MANQHDHTNVSVAFGGHVDCGKSTTLGHMLFALGGLDQRSADRLRAEAEALGKASFRWAFITDRLKAERERGITINVSTRDFFTQENHFCAIDLPGHRDFIKNAVTGLAQADILALVVSAAQGEFEASMQAGNPRMGVREGGLRTHLQAAFAMGVRRLCVLVNKMDQVQPPAARETRFNEVQAEVTRVVARLAPTLAKHEVQYVPISGWQETNLVREDDFGGWYQGPTMLTALDDAAASLLDDPGNTAHEHGPLRMLVGDYYKIKGVGDVITGKVIGGEVKPGQEVHIAGRSNADEPVQPAAISDDNSGTAARRFAEYGRPKVFSIECFHRMLDVGIPGSQIGVNLKGVRREKMPQRGDVLGLADLEPVRAAKEFTIRGILSAHPGQLRVGWEPIFDVGTRHVACRFVEILEKTGSGGRGDREENPRFIKRGDMFVARVQPKQPMVVEPFSQCPPLGRVLMREGSGIVGVAKVESVDGFTERALSLGMMTKSARMRR